MRIALGADQNGFALKEAIKEHLLAGGHEVVDHGVGDGQSADYPDIAAVVARQVATGAVERAILVCGTGLGMAIAANKVPGVRAGSVTDPYSAERLVKSNAAQVLCLGGRVVGAEVAKLLVDHFMGATFQGGASLGKVAKLEALDGSSALGAAAASAVLPEAPNDSWDAPDPFTQA
jgi:ribose 5-phosphate isomerase B